METIKIAIVYDSTGRYYDKDNIKDQRGEEEARTFIHQQQYKYVEEQDFNNNRIDYYYGSSQPINSELFSFCEDVRKHIHLYSQTQYTIFLPHLHSPIDLLLLDQSLYNEETT